MAEKVVNGPEDLGFSAAWFASPTSFPPLDTLVPGTGCPQVEDARTDCPCGWIIRSSKACNRSHFPEFGTGPLLELALVAPSKTRECPGETSHLLLPSPRMEYLVLVPGRAVDGGSRGDQHG